MKTPSGLKNKTVILHTTTTTKVRNRPHQKIITYPHGLPAPLQEDTEFLCGGEGVIQPPLPALTGLEVEAKKPLLLLDREMYKSTEKINKYD